MTKTKNYLVMHKFSLLDAGVIEKTEIHNMAVKFWIL